MLARVTHRFYSKILADERINAFFSDADLDSLQRMQSTFLALLLGGPREYTGLSMRSAHARLVMQGLNDLHFDVVVQHLMDTVSELKVSPELAAKIAQVAESTREDVFGRTPELFRKARGGQ